MLLRILSRLRLRELDRLISLFLFVSTLFLFYECLPLIGEVDRFLSNEDELWDEDEDELEEEGVNESETYCSQYLSPI